MPEEDMMSESAIRSGLRTRLLGRTVFLYTETESTNGVAAELAARGAPEGTLVVAEMQTKGRGGGGLPWDSPKSMGIWASLVLKPHIAPTDTGYITLLVGKSIVEAIRRRTGLEAAVRWPNDVLIDGKKVCGVLTEARLCRQGLRYVVAGFGVNVLQTQRQFPVELRDRATSLYVASGRKHSRVALLQEILVQIERRYRALGKGTDPGAAGSEFDLAKPATN